MDTYRVILVIPQRKSQFGYVVVTYCRWQGEVYASLRYINGGNSSFSTFKVGVPNLPQPFVILISPLSIHQNSLLLIPKYVILVFLNVKAIVLFGYSVMIQIKFNMSGVVVQPSKRGKGQCFEMKQNLTFTCCQVGPLSNDFNCILIL